MCEDYIDKGKNLSVRHYSYQRDLKMVDAEKFIEEKVGWLKETSEGKKGK